MRLCTECNVGKPFDSFHKDKKGYLGLKSKCKGCAKRINSKRYEDKKEHILSLNKAWRDENKEYWNGRPHDPVKRKARDAVNNAVKAGTLVKHPCEVCGELKVEGHHDDYSKPLCVRWLCNACHNHHHKFGEMK